MLQQSAQMHIKSIAIDEEERVIVGIASTPAPDRAGDVVKPEGVKYALPIPLLWQHDHNKPIGEVVAVEQKNGQLHIRAQIKKIDQAGSLKERVDEAWHAIKNGLVKGLSVGFRGIKYAFNDQGGMDFEEWEWLELSAVTVPCNREAVIQGVKSLAPPDKTEPSDEKLPENRPTSIETNAVSPTANFLPTRPAGQKGQSTMTLTEQKNAARAALMEKQAQIVAKEAEKLAENADVLAIEAEVAQLDAQAKSFENNIERLEKIEKMQEQIKQKAVEIPAAPAIVKARNLPNLEKGVPFAQFVRAKMLSQHEARKHGNFISPVEAAKSLRYSDDVVDYIQKATLGTTTDPGFAKPLVEPHTYTGDFLELLRNATVFNRLGGFRNVPFNVKINGQVSGGTAQWVGEGAAKPLTNPTFGQVEIKEHKLAAITVYTLELLRRADPAIDMLVRDDLIAASSELIDATFLDDSAGDDTRPAGMLYGASHVSSTGSAPAELEADLMSLLGVFVNANLSTDGSYFLMSETRAMQIALMRDPLGNSYFNGMNFSGTRSLLGLPVITSKSIGDKIILIKTSEIMVAQDGGVEVAYSDQATLTDGGTTHHLWQENKFAVRVEKFITWAKRRPIAVAYIG